MAILLPFALLCALCVAVAWIDIHHGIIPDWLNFSIATLGLLGTFLIADTSAVVTALGEGALVGAVFWLLRRLYFAFRGIQGLGMGDVKFLGAAGIWVGIAGIPMLLLVATITALACVGAVQFSGRALTARTSMSFGPFLAGGLLVTSGFQQFGF
jgi:leader peptidase (prepilin peptidase) / N-methyltransferase